MYIDGVSMAETFTDKDDEFNDYLIVNSVYGRGVLERDNTLLPTLAMDGAYPSYSRFPVRELTVEITVKAPSFDELRKKVERLSKFVNSSKEVEISFADEMDRRYYGRLGTVDGDLETNRIMKTTLTFECSDPFKYGDTRVVERPDGALPVYNNGYDSYPIIELEAKQKTTFAMISDGTNYNIAGTLADDDVEVVDTKETMLELDGMDGWTYAGVESYSRFPKVTGTMQWDGTGMRPQNFGTGDKIHGPGVSYELPENVEDFEIEAEFDIISERDVDNFRMEIRLKDENMETIGMIGIKDNTKYRNERTALGRVGPYRGSGKSSGYLIGDATYVKEFGSNTLMHMKFKREGDVFDISVGRWRVNRLQETYRDKYVDKKGEYNGKLRYVEVLIGSFGDRAKPARLRITRLDVHKLTKVTEDQTPYILEPGDVLTFDHDSRNILVNGEPRLDLKNFGGTWFPLKEGQQTIVVSPEDAFDATLTFEERFI